MSSLADISLKKIGIVWLWTNNKLEKNEEFVGSIDKHWKKTTEQECFIITRCKEENILFVVGRKLKQSHCMKN